MMHIIQILAFISLVFGLSLLLIPAIGIIIGITKKFLTGE